MSATRTIPILIAACIAAHVCHGAVPCQIPYQVKVAVDASNWTGAVQFKFAILGSNEFASVWSNDGTATGEPLHAVSVVADNGAASMALGDTALANMAALPASVFASSQPLRLRVWMATGTRPFEALVPDMVLRAAPFALNAALLDGIAPTAFADTTTVATLSSQLEEVAFVLETLAGETALATSSLHQALIWLEARTVYDASNAHAALSAYISNGLAAVGTQVFSTANIADQAITASKLASNSVTQSALQYGAVSASKLADDVDERYVGRSGAQSIEGPLVIATTPAAASHAVTKNYVDTKVFLPENIAPAAVSADKLDDSVDARYVRTDTAVGQVIRGNVTISGTVSATQLDTQGPWEIRDQELVLVGQQARITTAGPYDLVLGASGSQAIRMSGEMRLLANTGSNRGQTGSAIASGTETVVPCPACTASSVLIVTPSADIGAGNRFWTVPANGSFSVYQADGATQWPFCYLVITPAN